MICIMIFVIAFLSGYIAGKCHGWKQGYRKAAAAVPLELREQSLLLGQCVLCDNVRSRIYENFSRDLDTL